MIIIDLIYNLALLTALSVLSGFIGKRCRERWRENVFQGFLFGAAAVIGMMRPLVLGPGVIFDGRSVMISLCGLFFGPQAVAISSAMAIACRLWLGGSGQLMGILVIVEAGALGLIFHYRQSRRGMEVPPGLLWFVGFLVHITMVMLMITLPYDVIPVALTKIAPPVILIYPLATVLIGKVLSDQWSRERFLTELQSSREAIRMTLYSIGDGIITTDSEGCVCQLNPVAEKLLGWKESEAYGKHHSDVFRMISEESREEVENPVARVLREGCIVGLTNHTLLIARDGRECPIADSGAPIRNKEGEIAGVVLVFRDQSAERAAQRAVQAERDNLRAIMTASPVAIMVLNEAEQMADANPAAEKLFGRRLSELSDRTLGDFLGCRNCGLKHSCGQTDYCSACAIRNALRTVFETGSGLSDREMNMVLRTQGAEKRCWIRFSMEQVVLGDRRHVLIAMNDISQHRQTEESLRRIEWMLSKKPQQPADQAGSDGVTNDAELMALNSDGRIRKTVSREMLASIVSEYLDLLGTSTSIYEVDGSYAYRRFDSGWCRMLDRASRALCGTADAAAALSSGRWRLHETCWGACSKEAVESRGPVDIACEGGMRQYAVPILMHEEVIGAICFGYGDPTRDPEQLRALANAYRLDFESVLHEASQYDTRPPYIIEMAKSRLRASAWLIGSLAEARQAQADRIKLEVQLHHAQKMDAIGRLAGGVAHDFNNILQSVIGYGELLLEKLPAAEETHEFAREIVVEGKRAATLTRQLLAFARKQAIDPRVLDLNEAVVATLKMLRRLLSEDIELCWFPAAEQCLVKIDTSQLEQILANLAVNARDAINGAGKVTLEVQKVEFDAAFCERNPGCAPGRYVMLAVSDDGCGMDHATLERLFEPFFTTKERGRGTGLGLATVYGIVKQNHGFINVYSEPDKGASFKIYLPVAAANEADVVEPPKLEPQATGTETVLIVDDEESLLRSGRRILEGLGYTVLSAENPAEALRVAQAYPHEIHLLLTDVVMPGMSGRDLWLKLENMRPQMKCIFMSGYTANIIAQRNALNKGVSFLQKPFSKAALANKMRDVLSS